VAHRCERGILAGQDDMPSLSLLIFGDSGSCLRVMERRLNGNREATVEGGEC
jgi:hypothetical protein